uniref:(northern house mosquito) hypothetical protein n=1 Tax=Culex pipiens TaxID=7175 RepID=A0A8D8N428_CULPI
MKLDWYLEAEAIACMVDQSHQGDFYGWKSFLDEVLLREGVQHADGVDIRIECIELDVVHFGVNCHDYRPLLLQVQYSLEIVLERDLHFGHQSRVAGCFSKQKNVR